MHFRIFGSIEKGLFHFDLRPFGSKFLSFYLILLFFLLEIMSIFI